jgi:hypothetical protein
LNLFDSWVNASMLQSSSGVYIFYYLKVEKTKKKSISYAVADCLAVQVHPDTTTPVHRIPYAAVDADAPARRSPSTARPTQSSRNATEQAQSR